MAHDMAPEQGGVHMPYMPSTFISDLIVWYMAHIYDPVTLGGLATTPKAD